jgi:hypothetical protein
MVGKAKVVYVEIRSAVIGSHFSICIARRWGAFDA